MLSFFFLLAYLLPLLAAIFLLIKKFNEETIFAITAIGIITPFLNTLIVTLAYLFYWWQFKTSAFEFDLGHLPLGKTHVLHIYFYLDDASLVLLNLTGYLSLLVVKFGRTYMHREAGHQRFFRTILLFVFGMELIALAGSMDLFFAGWEFVGLCSFLLIGFYRDRTRPIKNALRIYYLYRLCDLALIFAALMAHQLWHNNAHFGVLFSNPERFIHHISPEKILIIGGLIIIASLGKSAQFPFINWPARAMEGPTPSSALFYGALSLHAGAFLLERTMPIWSISWKLKTLIIVIGGLTFLFSSLIGKVQSNIKGRMAYASSAQVGLIYIELALGLRSLALLHLFVHCLYRCYQILITPSSVIDHIKTIHTLNPNEKTIKSKFALTLYWFAANEGLLEISERGRFFYLNVKAKIKARHFVHSKIGLLIFLLGTNLFWKLTTHTAMTAINILAFNLSVIGLWFSFRALTSYQSPKKIWKELSLAVMAPLLAAGLLSFELYFSIILYLATAIPCLYLGYKALKGTSFSDMHIYNGLSALHSGRTFPFIIAFVGLSGAPLSTTFFAEDIILGHLLHRDIFILGIIGLTFTFNAMASARLLAKVFFGHPSRISI